MLIGARTGAWKSSGIDWGGKTVIEATIPDGGATFSFCSVNPSSATIDWGDGTVDIMRSHAYASGGVYLVQISESATDFRTVVSTPNPYVTAVYNLGRNLTTLSRALGWNAGCPNLLTIESVDTCPLVTSLYEAFRNAYNLQRVTLPENFAINATDFQSVFSYAGYGFGYQTVLDLPTTFGRNATNLYGAISGVLVRMPSGIGLMATNLERAFYYCMNETIIFPEGFGCVATNITHMIGNSYVLRDLSLPSGFGANAENGKHQFIFVNNRKPNFTKLTMHGHQNGIRYSLDLKVTYIDVPSVCSVMESLQTSQTTQTLTLNNNMRSTYEASADYIAARDALTARGWQVAFA